MQTTVTRSGMIFHATQTMIHPELGAIEVDELVIPLVKALWDNGIDTAFSCQGGWMHHGAAWFKANGYIVITDRRLTSSAHRVLTLTGAKGVHIRRWPNRFVREHSSLGFSPLGGRP